MTSEELKSKLDSHKLWLSGDESGCRANLSDANLSDADLSDANLSRANLSDAKNVILQFKASRHQVNVIDNMVRIGCQNHDLQWWLENYQAVGRSERYTEKEIAEYGMILDHIKRVLELRMEAKSEVAPPSVTGDEMKVEKASLIFQIDGKCYAALTKDIDLDMLVNFMAALYPDKQVKMVELPEGVHFEKYNQTALSVSGE
jgi:hypothetical protein